MKELKFKDKKTFTFTDASSLESLVTVVNNYSELDAIKNEFEAENNLIGGIFDGEAISQRVYTGVTTAAEASGNITAVFTTRPYTHDEIVDARLADLEDAVADM